MNHSRMLVNHSRMFASDVQSFLQSTVSLAFLKVLNVSFLKYVGYILYYCISLVYAVAFVALFEKMMWQLFKFDDDWIFLQA